MALRWAASVTTHEAAARTNKGIFSTIRRSKRAGGGLVGRRWTRGSAVDSAERAVASTLPLLPSP